MSEGDQAIGIDSVLGSDGAYFPTQTTSNTGPTWANLMGEPDGGYVTMGGDGYSLITAAGNCLSSIQVYGKE